MWFTGTEHTLYPETRTCTNPHCTAHDQLLRLWELPTRVQVFTLRDGVRDACAVHLTCRSCKTVYYPNYAVHDTIRQYYTGIPDYIQVSGHRYIESSVLAHFTTLSVLSWTSATNAAHIYRESLARLGGDVQDEPRFQLRASHTWDGFVLLALLRDMERTGGVLQVPHGGHQKDRFTEAMRARNERIRRSGQPEYAHWCTRCVRRVDDTDGITRFVDCIITDGIEMGRPCCSVHNCTGQLQGCCLACRTGCRTCAAHAAVEEHHLQTGKAMFTLRTRLQRAQLAIPTDAIDPSAPADVDLDGGPDDTCPSKPSEGNQRVRARFGRRRTHNEQLIVRPCGIITARETFVGAESLKHVAEMLEKKHLIPGSLPRFIFYDNNCGLYTYSKATGKDLHERAALPVDVFHWTCKHKKTDEACSVHCNPHNFPELLTDDNSWTFNSSRAEQTNVWFGGYHAIVREMGQVKYEFFLDEMILEKNELTRAKLETEGCMPSYRHDLRFTQDVSV
ncbi:hypothetical protein GY45DRAFT_1393616 [Cubamyces sp. BRFM 1775]|nr:hypothetical protein GY45DRAFT_1393616 [Cubamyces sp. BRFM 1775]